MANFRPNLAAEIDGQRDLLVHVFAALKSACHANWYPSLWAERRCWDKYDVNDREEHCSESSKEGVVLRIYDGVTLFEEACDDFEQDVLLQRVVDLTERAKAQGVVPRKPAYVPPTWRERTSVDLEDDILKQVPVGADPDTWVHFGVACDQELWDSKDVALAHVRKAYLAMGAYPQKFSVDFTQVMMRLERDDFIFIDSESRMSQSILRNMMAGVLMKNGERGRAFVGGVGGRETVRFSPENVEEAYSHLKKILDADRITPGRYKLLMHPAITGVFAHEAFGHSQEADTWARGRSKAKDLFEQGTQVGNKMATIVNNPAVYHNGSDDHAAWGSYYFDEEGWLAQKHFLVKEGLLQRPMTNLTSALRLGVPRTANGKREAWTNGVYSRQTNTYFSEGEQTLEQLLGSVDYGFMATCAAGGMEDPKGMGIQVGIEYLEEIKDGKLTGKTFKGPGGGSVQMTGYVPDYLNSIMGKTKIDHMDDGKDEARHPWNDVGGCGKYHKELVNAGCGGPYMLVDKVLLG